MSGKRKEWSIRYLDTVQPVDVKWLAYPYIPQGKFVLLSGDPAVGKSTLAVSIAAALTTGRPILESKTEPQTGNVLYLSAEDNVADTLKPRLMSAGADCSKVAIVECANLDLSDDLHIFDEAVRDTKARLIILDPLTAFIGKDADLGRAADMRRLLGALAVIAEKYECTALAISHQNKAAGIKSLYRSLGSIDIAALARSVMLIERSEDEPDIRVIKHIKSSLAPEASPLAFCICNNSSITFLGEYEGRTDCDDNILEDGKREWASNTILSLLSTGPRSGADIQKVCADAGISERTVNRAKKDLGVRSVRNADGWDWTLIETKKQ
jgi:RecA-family ATPase